MGSDKSSTLPIVAALASLVMTFGSGAAIGQHQAAPGSSPVQRTGSYVISAWTGSVKTDNGKVFRRYEAVYDWDTGLTHRFSYDANGNLISKRTLDRAPTPSPDEIADAIAIVRDDPEVHQIQRRQTGIVIDGGFAIQQAASEGPCTQGSRCLQIFLFDGDNVVRHMLVDLKTNTIVDHDYVPPRNREAAR